jgi:hypothetical protein
VGGWLLIPVRPPRTNWLAPGSSSTQGETFESRPPLHRGRRGFERLGLWQPVPDRVQGWKMRTKGPKCGSYNYNYTTSRGELGSWQHPKKACGDRSMGVLDKCDAVWPLLSKVHAGLRLLGSDRSGTRA